MARASSVALVSLSPAGGLGRAGGLGALLVAADLTTFALGLANFAFGLGCGCGSGPVGGSGVGAKLVSALASGCGDNSTCLGSGASSMRSLTGGRGAGVLAIDAGCLACIHHVPATASTSTAAAPETSIAAIVMSRDERF